MGRKEGKPVERSARLFLIIRVGKKQQAYQLTPHKTDPGVASRAWRLWRRGGKKFYDISINDKGWTTCTCADSNFRTHGRCKHVLAAKALGLL